MNMKKNIRVKIKKGKSMDGSSDFYYAMMSSI